MRLHVAVEVVTNEVIITVFDNRIAKGAEPASVAEPIALDGVEDLGKIRVKLEGAVVVGVAKLFDVFR